MKRKPPVADASDWMAPFKAPGVRVKLNAGVMDMIAVQGMIAESDNPALASDTFWKVTNAADLIREGGKQKVGCKLGGKKGAATAKANAAEWQLRCVDKAREMLKQGTLRHELAGKLGKQFGCSAHHVRNVLKKAEVK